MIGFDVLTKAITLAGSAISTKRANDEAEKAANEHYADQQAYLSAQANSDAMATTAAKAAMGAIDKSEQRAQERERSTRAVTGGTEMASMRSKQMASDARAEAASNIHLQQQQQKLKYDTMLQRSKQAEYEERQARIDAKRQSAQNMVTNAMQIGAMAGSALGGTKGMTDKDAAKSLGIKQADMNESLSPALNNDGSIKIGGDGTAVAYAKAPDVKGLEVTPIKASDFTPDIKAPQPTMDFQKENDATMRAQRGILNAPVRSDETLRERYRRLSKLNG